MGDETNFFAMPAPEEQAPPPVDDIGGGIGGGEEETSGFTFLGDAPTDPNAGGGAPFVGDVAEGGGGDDDDGLGFAAAPSTDTGAFEDAHMGFASPDAGGYAPPPTSADGGGVGDFDEDPFGAVAPSSDDAPIILAGPPPPGEDNGDIVEDAGPTEPTPMQKFNEEWQATLLERKEDENNKKAELLEAARIAMETFQKEREAKLETKLAKNREDEQAKLEAIEADLENDNSWQRVCKLVELQHEGTVQNVEDVKRMRDVMILLKNEPTRAASVGA